MKFLRTILLCFVMLVTSVSVVSSVSSRYKATPNNNIIIDADVIDNNYQGDIPVVFADVIRIPPETIATLLNNDFPEFTLEIDTEDYTEYRNGSVTIGIDIFGGIYADREDYKKAGYMNSLFHKSRQRNPIVQDLITNRNDLTGFSTSDAEMKAKDFLNAVGNIGFEPIIDIYPLHVQDIQNAADLNAKILRDMYGEDDSFLNYEYSKEDECYLVYIRFADNGVIINTTQERDINRRILMGANVHLLIDKYGYRYIGVNALYQKGEYMPQDNKMQNLDDAIMSYASFYEDVLMNPSHVRRIEFVYLPTAYDNDIDHVAIRPSWCFWIGFDDDSDTCALQFYDAYTGELLCESISVIENDEM